MKRTACEWIYCLVSVIGIVVFSLYVWLLYARGGTVATDVVSPYVEIRTDDGLGSGTCIKVGDETLILTAGHVVKSLYNQTHDYRDADGKPVVIPREKPLQATLYREEGDSTLTTKADVVWYSAPDDEGGHDLALLRPVCLQGLTPAALGLDEKLEVGEDCWYCGSPDGVSSMLERSILNNLKKDLGFPGGRRFLVVNGLGWYGNSGGGVFIRVDQADSDPVYKLVGVVVMIDSNNPKSAVFCEPPSVVKDFLADYQKSKTQTPEPLAAPKDDLSPNLNMPPVAEDK